jgi:hypothetical protein
MATEKEKIEEMETPIESPDTTDVSPEVTVTEETTTVSPTSRSRKWMQNKYAGKVWEDDAMYDDDLVAHLEDTDARLASYAESDERIARILDLNPDFALVLNAMDKGMPFLVALRRYAGDIFESAPVEGDDDFEAYREAAEAYLAEKNKTDAEIATRNTNLEDSEKRFVTFVESQGWDEAKQDEFVKFVVDSINALGMGEVSERFLSIMKDAFTHDEDVEDAKEAGAIEARNEKITAKRIKEAETTDGVPIGGGSSPVIEEDMEEEDDFLGSAARRYRNREFK